jgi:hypothetical protein
LPRRRPLGQYTLQAGDVEGKYFYPTVEQAAALSRSNFATQGTQTITSITVPQSLLNGAYIGNVAGEGQTFSCLGRRFHWVRRTS